MTRQLVATALGRTKADLVIRNATLVNVNSGELLENQDIAVTGDRIALVGEASHTIGSSTSVVDVRGKYVAPGFVDGHVHIESSMITVTQFARAVLPWGTTTCCIDPHEIGNVLGVPGVRLMLDEAQQLPLKVFVTAPSCVPASAFETPGAQIGPMEIEEMMQWDGVIALGEMMNYPAVLAGDEGVHGEIAATLHHGRVVEGHDTGLLGRELAAYAAAGITSSHESVRKVDALQRLRLGMYAMLRQGSAWLDVPETVKCVTEAHADPRHVCVVTDDREPDSIVRDGHMNHAVRVAIEHGVDPVTAIQMGTLNPAEHFEIAREVGSIAPSRLADIIVLDSLTQMRIDRVFADGRLVAAAGKPVIEFERPSYPDVARRSVHLSRDLKPEDFVVKSPVARGEVEVRVIGALEGSVLTRQLVRALPVRNGHVQPKVDEAILKTALVQRHSGSTAMGVGFTHGFAFGKGAVASTVAHDAHNLLVLGTNDRDMAVAANTLADVGGGIVTVVDGETVALVELPIAGLMSEQPVEEVSAAVSRMYTVWQDLGCRWISPFMTMSLLGLTVLPELRLSDRGLVDTVKFEFVSPFA
jgi:adenine deaminase